MNIGKLISTFVVSCLFALSLTMGANVNAQTGVRRTSEAQESSQKMSKKKHGKHKHKRVSHHRG
jgi:hypothetical protein